MGAADADQSVVTLPSLATLRTLGKSCSELGLMCSSTYTSPPCNATPHGAQGFSAFKIVVTLPSDVILMTQPQPVAATYITPRESTASPRKEGVSFTGTFASQSSTMIGLTRVVNFPFRPI